MGALATSVLTGIMLLLALVAMFSMLEFWGTHERRPSNPKLLLWIHRLSGWLFVSLFMFMMVVMVARLGRHHGELSARLVAHFVIALALLPVLFLKILIVRRYGGLAQLVIPLGVVITVLAVCLAGPTAGYYVLKRLSGGPMPMPMSPELAADGPPNLTLGSQLLQHKCTKCHTLERVYALKLPREAWRRTVEQMRQFDPAHISPPEARQIVHYLAETLAPPKELTPQQTVLLEGRVLIESRCARRCHNLEKVLAVRRDKGDWVRIVHEMVEQAGGTITQEDIPIIINYLVQERSISPGTPHMAAAGEALLYKKCVKCHNLDRVFRKRKLTEAQWNEIVAEMIRYDRKWISVMEGRAIAHHLARTLR